MLTLQNNHPVKFQSIEKEMIRKATIRTKGISGLSGMDAYGWRGILAFNDFGTSSSHLYKALANAVQKFCTDLAETHIIQTFLSCCLIPLDKNPGSK